MGEGRMWVTIRAGELVGRPIASATCLRSSTGNDGEKFGDGNVNRHDWKCRKKGREFELSQRGGWGLGRGRLQERGE